MSFLDYFKTKRVPPSGLLIGDIIYVQGGWWTVCGLKFKEDSVSVYIFSEFGDSSVSSFLKDQNGGVVCIERTSQQVEPTPESTKLFIKETQLDEWFD